MTEWLAMLRPQTAQRLIINGQKNEPLKGTRREQDFIPACKLFVPWGAATWLLSEMSDDGLAFGLCDMGFGQPELGYVSLDEVWAITGPGGIHVEEDRFWTGIKPLSEYAEDAKRMRRIVA